jgi:ribonucrease Y
MDVIITIVVALVTMAAGVAGTYFYFKNQKQEAPEVAELTDEEVKNLLRKHSAKRFNEVEAEVQEIKAKSETNAKNNRQEMIEQENILLEREKSLNERSKIQDKKADELETANQSVKDLKANVEKERERLETELEKISGLSREEAREKLTVEIEEEMKNYTAKLIRKATKEAEATSDEKAKEILVDTMQSIATDYVGETTTSTVKIEDEKVKGRVIGKEGRNIRAFEKATGVDVNIDEAPDAIGLSSFDPLRREIAKVALTKLVKDGRIHPGSIEEEIRKAKNEVALEIKKNGQIMADETGWPGMDLGLLKLVGKLKYRTSYGQSMMSHTIEVIRIGAALAQELGADVELVKRACLLHDIGKVLTHKVEGKHHHISGQIARKYKLPDKLVNAIEAHHLDIEVQSLEAVIVYLADAISGARPGARKDSYENFIKRVEGIENAAKEIGGDMVDDVYAIHAGREVRVIVKPKGTTDDGIVVMAKKIADQIEKTQTYPGTVEVTVIREVRALETAS